MLQYGESEGLEGWRGRRVKLKGLIGGHPEVMMEAELVEASALGVLMSWRDRKTFFPWSVVYSLALDEEAGS
jgi:hypothetical protein